MGLYVDFITIKHNELMFINFHGNISSIEKELS